MWINDRISRPLLVLVCLSFMVFFVCATTVIGFKYYTDLISVKQDQTQSAAKLFKSEFENEISRTEYAIASVESNKVVVDNLTLLNQYGPLYSEDTTQSEIKLTDSDTSYYLQSQLILASTLLPLLPQYNLTSLAIFQVDPFSNIRNPLPSFFIGQEELWVFRYFSKGGNSKFKVYSMALQDLELEENLFNVSDIYNRKPEFFFEEVGLKESNSFPFDSKELFERSRPSGVLANIINDQFSVSIWSSILLSISNPNTWEKERVPAATILGIRTPTKDNLLVLGNQIGGEFSIIDDDITWVSGLKPPRPGEEEQYLTSTLSLDIPSKQDLKFKILSRTTATDIIDDTLFLVFEMTIIAAIMIMLTAFALYMLTNYILNNPLNNILKGVKSVEQGNLDFKIENPGTNELSKISESFNSMVLTVKETSDSLKSSNENLEQTVKERSVDLLEAQEQLILSEKMASLGQLVAGVAHEINTPLGNSLTALSFSAESSKRIKKLFDSGELTAKNFEAFMVETEESNDIIDANLNKAKELVQSFKTVATNQSVEELEAFSVMDQINHILKTLNPTLRKHQVEIHIDVDEFMQLKSYAGAFYHIISNFIMNSLIHAFPDNKGNIWIAVFEENDRTIIRFKDDGEGMDEETRKHIFDQFFTTKKGKGGTGLGMHITHNLVTEKLQGEVSVESTIGEGTQFNISLPINH